MSGSKKERFKRLSGKPAGELTEQEKTFMAEVETTRIDRQKYFLALKGPKPEKPNDEQGKTIARAETEVTQPSPQETSTTTDGATASSISSSGESVPMEAESITKIDESKVENISQESSQREIVETPLEK